MPADPRWYVLDETVKYNITVYNHSDIPLYFDVDDDDISPIPGNLYHVEYNIWLSLGKSKTLPVSYVIQSADVSRTYKDNTAHVFFHDTVGGDWVYIGNFEFNTVRMPVIGDTPVSTPPKNKKPNGNGEIKTPVPEGDCCSRSLTYMSSYDEEYLLHYCDEHIQVQRMVVEAVEAAQTDGARFAAWQ